MAPLDPHSFTDSSHPLTKRVDLCFFLDFEAKIILGSATLHLERPHTGELFLDSRSLHVQGASDPTRRPIPFSLLEPDRVKGSLLRVTLSEQRSISISFKTDPSASALQWLDPLQTAGKKLPYVYTQCQSIHARSIFPCQDTPVARIQYAAKINIPQDMRVVMSAAHVGRSTPSPGEANGACEESRWMMGGRVVEHFLMEQPIPPYLFALAAGDIAYEDLSPRSRVYAEPPELSAAAHEFVGVEAMVQQGEALFGPYEWERFDLLVMPPSFPYGGMENPRMVFLTPTVIVGDRSGVQVVAHELAHSWTGNLITNASNNDFWLNEVGRVAFDGFLKKYISSFKFLSIDTEMFLVFLKEQFPGIQEQIDLDMWAYGSGIPLDALVPTSAILQRVLSLAEGFDAGQRLSKDDCASWQALEWQIYLENLPKKLNTEQVKELDKPFSFSENCNWEIRVAFLTIAAFSGYEPCFPVIEHALHTVGRMKYLRPLYSGLLQSSTEAKKLAKRVFESAMPTYHPIAQSVVQGLLKKFDH
eukprot:c16812_g1_i2 orf=341-1930(+)